LWWKEGRLDGVLVTVRRRETEEDGVGNVQASRKWREGVAGWKHPLNKASVAVAAGHG
jgi:hypothetical protein